VRYAVPVSNTGNKNLEIMRKSNSTAGSHLLLGCNLQKSVKTTPSLFQTQARANPALSAL
jgi:hypothetical protein